MPKGNRNIPSQRKPRKDSPTEIINKLITPNDLINRGNPNPTLNHNRGEDISVRGDVNKDFKIGLEDLFNAVKYYINDVVKPSVIEGDQMIPVKTEYAFSERWNAAQKEGFLRDREGRALLPAIAIKRSTITRNRNLGNKLDGNKVHNYQVFHTQYNRKNIYDNFAVLTNRIPVKEFRISPVPDYVIVTYNCSIFCNMQEDIDSIIQAFTFVADSYWGQYDRFRFKVAIDEFSDSIEYSQGEDRSVRSDFNIILNGYLLPDTLNRDMAIQKKILSKATIKFSMETTSADLETFSVSAVNNPNKIPVTIIDSYIHQGTSAPSAISPEILSYIQTDIELTVMSGSVFGNSAIFHAGFLTAPVGLSATSINNFIFFANGQYLNTGSLVSFIDNGNNTSTLTVNTGSIGSGGLGYGFGSDWQITARGKFKE